MIKSRQHFFIADATKRLDISKFNKKTPLLHALHHESRDVPNRYRQKRSDGARGVFEFCQQLVSHMDLATFECGIYRHNKQNNRQYLYTRSQQHYADSLGYHVQTIKRYINHLVRAGYIKTERRGEYVDGQYKNHTGVLTFTNKFFQHLGFKLKKIKEVQSYKQKNIVKRTKSIVVNGFKQVGAFIKAPQKKAVKLPPVNKSEASMQQEKNLIGKALEIAKSTGRSASEVLLELKSQT